MMKYILSLDVGTTNVRSYIYNSVGCPVFSESQNVEIISPELGSSEIEPDHLWSVIRAVVQSAVDWGSKNSIQLAGIGISLQRNTGNLEILSLIYILRITQSISCNFYICPTVKIYLFRNILGSKVRQDVTQLCHVARRKMQRNRQRSKQFHKVSH